MAGLGICYLSDCTISVSHSPWGFYKFLTLSMCVLLWCSENLMIDLRFKTGMGNEETQISPWVLGSQHFWRGIRSALKYPQRQPLPWCTGQPSQRQLFLLSMFSNLCKQASRVQNLPTSSCLQAGELVSVGASRLAQRWMMLLSEGPFEVFCAQVVLAKSTSSAWLWSTGDRHKYNSKWETWDEAELIVEFHCVDIPLLVTFLTRAAIEDFVAFLF